MYSFKLEIFEWTWHLQMVKTYVVQLTFGKNNIHKSRQQNSKRFGCHLLTLLRTLMFLMSWNFFLKWSLQGGRSAPWAGWAAPPSKLRTALPSPLPCSPAIFTKVWKSPIVAASARCIVRRGLVIHIKECQTVFIPGAPLQETPEC